MHNNNNYHREGNGKAALAFLAGAATAVAVGGYLFFGPKGKERREEAQDWIDDAEDKVLSKMSELKGMTKEKYESLVDEVACSYEDAKELTKSQAARLGARLKSRYREMRELARDSAKSARKEAEEIESEEESRTRPIQKT